MSKNLLGKKAVVILLLAAMVFSGAASFAFAQPLFPGGMELPPEVDGALKTVALLGDALLPSLGPKPLPPISQEAKLRGIQPATLKNIHLKLKPGVEWLGEGQMLTIKEHASGGKISASRLPGIEPGKIYVDPFSLLALEFLPSGDGSFFILMADEENIVEEISIPEQTVFLNEANITYLAEGVNVSAFKRKSGITETTGFNLIFDETYKLPGYDQEGKLVQVSLKGSLQLNYPAVEVKYSENSGYKFIFMASQNAELRAEFLAQLKKDVKIPLKEFSIPARGCNITVGLFLVLGVDGKITLEYSVKQDFTVRAGFEGRTKYYLPTSFNTVKEVSFNFLQEDFSLTADVKGELSVLAEVTFDILGKGKVNIDNKIGVLLEAKASAGTGGGSGSSSDYLSVKGDAFVKISGKVKVSSFDKSKTIYEYKYPIFNYVKERSGSYSIEIAEACAYRDIIRGKIVEKGTGKPYANSSIQLKVTEAAGTERILSANTDSAGNFNRAYDLKNGDMVAVKIPGSADLWSHPREASFPFKHIAVDLADYLLNELQGHVSGSAGGGVVYNGPVSVFIERSNNIPLHYEGDLSLPVEYTIRLLAQSTGGFFRLQGVDLRPYDRVYAVIERDGFTLASSKVETEGFTLSVAGGYLQEASRLSSLNSAVILSHPRGASSSAVGGEALFKVAALYPHSTTPENSYRSRQWQLRFSSGGDHLAASTGPWELDLNNLAYLINSPLDKVRSSLSGKRSVNYHVYETVELYAEGKKIVYFSEAKDCEVERRSALMSLMERSGKSLPPLNLDTSPSLVPGLIPAVGSRPADYFLLTMEGMLRETLSGEEGAFTGDGRTGSLSTPSPQDGSADITIRSFSGPGATTPYSVRNFKLSLLGHEQKLESSWRDYVFMWDKNAKTKVLQNLEFGWKQSARYDLDDYIPELKDFPFLLKGETQVNGIPCKLWEKSRKIDPLMNIYVKVELYLSKSSDLPVKVVFYDGYLQKIELLFNNWQKASSGTLPAGGSRLFLPPFGEFSLPSLPLELPSSGEESDTSSSPSLEGEDRGSSDGGMEVIGERESSTAESRVTIALAIGDPYMSVNGRRFEIDPGRGTEPLIKAGRTILPIRAIVEALGGTIGWEENERKITIAGGGTVIEMWIGSTEMKVNEAKITNDVPPEIINARTYVPLRFVAENLKCAVGWESQTRTVTIVSGE